ncbi:uncharacterized protein LOC144912656 [Branchiostoma floridae x Branchiostoma belcheri]
MLIRMCSRINITATYSQTHYSRKKKTTSIGGVTSRPGRGTWSAGSPANLEQRTGVECRQPGQQRAGVESGCPAARSTLAGAARTLGRPPDFSRAGTELYMTTNTKVTQEYKTEEVEQNTR